MELPQFVKGYFGERTDTSKNTEEISVDAIEKRTGTSKNTEEKSVDAMEEMLNSVVEDRKLMFDLNKKFENLYMENRYAKEITNTVEFETFSEYQKTIENKYFKKIQEIKLDFKKQMDKQYLLEESIRTKDTEIDELREEIRNYKEKIQNIKKTNEQKYKDACTKQKQAQRERDKLKTEMTISKKTFEVEKEVLIEKLSSTRTTLSSSGEPNSDDFDKKVETIEGLYNTHLEKLKKEMKMSYEHKIKQIKTEKEKVESERDFLQQEIREHDMEFQTLKNEQTELGTEILKYKRLLIQKTNTEEQKGETTVETTGHTATKSEKSSKIEITNASESRNDPDKPSVSDLKLNPLSFIVDPTGNVLTIHNSSKSQDVDVSNWIIERTHSKGMISFVIPKGNKISAEKDLKIWSISASDKKGPGDIVANCQTWETGKGEITVRDNSRKEMSRHHIK